MKLTGKVALVTGATRGIGQAIAIALGEAGATIIGTATSEEGAQKISKNFNEKGIRGRGVTLNVTHVDYLDSLLDEIKKVYDFPTILINNAAITRDNLLLRMKADEWNDVINTNLNSIFYLSKACIRHMLKARWGRIISLSSVVGFTGNPGQANYAAAKAGLVGFSKSLAQEVGSRGITVNVVAPGFIDTDMTRVLSEEQKTNLLGKIPLQRLGKPEDIAGAVLFLASEQGAYITGETLHVNGGMYMS
jgi:3-oxoacyl-[acyl-carrier protein] reductase